MRNIILACIFLLTGCIEYTHHGDTLIVSVPNPIAIEAALIEERFYNPAARPANILFAIDRSCSMGDNQLLLWNNMEEFVGILEEDHIDYRIGIASTDASSASLTGRLGSYNEQKWVDENTIDYVAGMQTLLATSGNTGEAGIEAINGALTFNYVPNEPFWRTQTPLHVITISDEEDQSLLEPDLLVDTVLDYEGWNAAPVSYTVIVHTPVFTPGCIGSGLATLVGHRYIEAANKLDGTVLDICTNWTSGLNDLAYLATEMPYEYNLKTIPDPESIQVYIEDGPITYWIRTSEWTYDPIRNSVKFNLYVPDNDTTVLVSYYPAK